MFKFKLSLEVGILLRDRFRVIVIKELNDSVFKFKLEISVLYFFLCFISIKTKIRNYD